MRIRSSLSLVVAWGALVLAAPAGVRYMPVAEVQPGMTGVGRTVFQGTRVEEFKAHILGTMHATAGPQRDIILARLEGGPLAKSGIIAGMSGSPVYIDGRLIGAVAYAVGSFATEPIAGITPIGEMIEAAADAPPAARVPPTPIGADMTMVMKAVTGALTRMASFSAARAPEGSPGRLPAGMPEFASFRPIALPLTVTGFDHGAAEPIVGPLSRAGLVAAPGGSRPWPPNEPAADTLHPGDPVGIALITGDLFYGATGTVTEVDGSRVYALGHALYNLGPVSYFMTRAYVHAVLPSLSSSMKLSSLGEVIGSIRQDRTTAVAGVFGERPRSVSMKVALRRSGGVARRFSFELAENPLLTPLLAYTALVGILSDHEHDVGPATFAVHGRLLLTGRPPIALDDVFTGDQAGPAAATAMASPLSALMTNDKEPVRVESVELEIDSAERIRETTIDRAWLDTAEVRRGETATLRILLRPWRGEKQVRSLDIEIPRYADGPLTLIVADGARLAQWEQRERRTSLLPDTLDQMIKLLNETRRGNRVYVRLVGRDLGAVVKGEAMPSLPSSVLAVMQGDRALGAGPVLQTSILGAWEIPADQAITGLLSVTVPLAPATPRP